MDATTDSELRLAAMFNTSNVAMARSQRLLQSWLPSSTQGQDKKQHESSNTGEEENEFKELGELSGLGSKSANKSDSPDKGALHSKLSSNDRLREQIMGKKAAQAHKKSKEMTAGKSMAAVKYQVPRQVTGATASGLNPMAEQSDDEDEGRAASFKSKKRTPKSDSEEVPAPVSHGTDASTLDGDDAIAAFAAKKQSAHTATNGASEEGNKPAKRKGGSYLDELLAEKSRKKSKKKNKAKPDN
ncbi:hypothetical protein MBLNU230_g3327t1 [Neophaeotheca triangularis]